MGGGLEGPPCSSNSGNKNDAGNFECNICLDLAQDPIGPSVATSTAGHVLYKWLHVHAHSHECPVCKAVIKEEKLVPIYGRGKASTDPRSKSVPGVDIPHRPAGRRPETAGASIPNQFNPNWFGFMGGFPPMATARFGNFTFSAGAGGLFPSLFNIYMHGFPYVASYGVAGGFPYSFPNAVHGRGDVRQNNTLGQQEDSRLATLLLVVGVVAIFGIGILVSDRCSCYWA